MDLPLDYKWPEPSKEDRERIPHGPYCYGEHGKCPFWSKIEGYPPQEDGYCAFLKLSDVDLQGGLLWDQVKECGVNDE